MNLNIRPKKTVKLGDQLHEQILDWIISGTLKEGGKIPSENELCKSFQVSRAMAKEFGPKGIRVNSLCPGMIATKFHGDFTKDQVGVVASGNELHRVTFTPTRQSTKQTWFWQLAHRSRRCLSDGEFFKSFI